MPNRAATALLALLAAAAWSPEAEADSAAACVDAHTIGRRLVSEKKLGKAREAFLRCAVDPCPSILRKECELGLRELDASQPTVVVEALDGQGRPTSSVAVIVDG